MMDMDQHVDWDKIMMPHLKSRLHSRGNGESPRKSTRAAFSEQLLSLYLRIGGTRDWRQKTQVRSYCENLIK
jgi:hypothetical protein